MDIETDGVDVKYKFQIQGAAKVALLFLSIKQKMLRKDAHAEAVVDVLMRK